MPFFNFHHYQLSITHDNIIITYYVKMMLSDNKISNVAIQENDIMITLCAHKC